MSKFIHLTGTANIAAGILLLAFWMLFAVLLPYQKLSTTLSLLVRHPNWVFVNLLGVLGSLIGLIGLIGIYLHTAETTGTPGMIGFLLAFVGTFLLAVPLVWDTLIWPILAHHDASLLDFSGPIYTSKTFVPFFISAGLVYSVGYLVFGIVLAQTGVFPSWSSILLAVGAPLFGLGAAFGQLQIYPRTLGITLFTVGLIWIGSILRTT